MHTYAYTHIATHFFLNLHTCTGTRRLRHVPHHLRLLLANTAFQHRAHAILFRARRNFLHRDQDPVRSLRHGRLRTARGTAEQLTQLTCEFGEQWVHPLRLRRQWWWDGGVDDDP